MSENASSIATSTNTQVQRRDITEKLIISNSIPYQFSKKITRQHHSNNGNIKISTLPNRFENLRLQDDCRNRSFQNNRTDNPSFMSKPILVPHESVQMQNQNDERIRFYLIEVEDHLSVVPKNIYKIRSLNKEWFLRLHHIQAQRNSKVKKYV